MKQVKFATRVNNPLRKLVDEQVLVEVTDVVWEQVYYELWFRVRELVRNLFMPREGKE